MIKREYFYRYEYGIDSDKCRVSGIVSLKSFYPNANHAFKGAVALAESTHKHDINFSGAYITHFSRI